MSAKRGRLHEDEAVTGAGSNARREDFVAARREMAARSIPELIDLLASEELRTRFLAEMCLREATGT